MKTLVKYTVIIMVTFVAWYALRITYTDTTSVPMWIFLAFVTTFGLFTLEPLVLEWKIKSPYILTRTTRHSCMDPKVRFVIPADKDRYLPSFGVLYVDGYRDTAARMSSQGHNVMAAPQDAILPLFNQKGQVFATVVYSHVLPMNPKTGRDTIQGLGGPLARWLLFHPRSSYKPKVSKMYLSMLNELKGEVNAKTMQLESHIFDKAAFAARNRDIMQDPQSALIKELEGLQEIKTHRSVFDKVRGFLTVSDEEKAREEDYT